MKCLIQNFTKENEENLLFYGDTGLGKTFMSNCIAKALLDKGFTVIYQTSFKMFEIIEEYKFHNINNSISKENYNNLFECDLLIIDDLGTELTNTFTVSELFMILNTRLLNKKKTIISTNFSLSKLAETYTERISSRIFDKFTLVKFVGKDLRWESKFVKKRMYHLDSNLMIHPFYFILNSDILKNLLISYRIHFFLL